MSSVVLALFVLVVLVLAAVAWRIYTRSRMAGEQSDPVRRLTAERFDTTLGDLRDVREALRPLAGATTKKTTSEQSKQ